MAVPASLDSCLNCGAKVAPPKAPNPRAANPAFASRRAPAPRPAAPRPTIHGYQQASAAPPVAAPAHSQPMMRREAVLGDDSRCAVCGRAPAARIQLLRYSGLLFLRPARVDVPFCSRHGEAAAREYLRRTLLEGWWGFFGAFRNWRAIMTNTRALREARRLGPPMGDIDTENARPLPEDVDAAVRETSEERADRISIARTVMASIGIGVVGLFLVFMIVDVSTESRSRLVAVSLLGTMFVYASVGIMLAYRMRASAVRPSVEGGVVGPAALGVLIGGGAGFVLAGLLSLLNGSPTSDGRLLLIMAEGGTNAVVIIVFITVLAAPFVEETLFRGMFAESLRGRGRSPAIFAAAVAFSVWHLNPSSVSYYVIMGFVLGIVYWRLGLAGSIGTHLAFNGVLVLFAVAAMGAGGLVTGPTGVTADLPSGWRLVEKGVEAELFEEILTIDLAAESVTGAAFLVQSTEFGGLGSEFGQQPSVPTEENLPPGVQDVRAVTVSGVNALRFTVESDGIELDTVLVPWGPRAYSVTMVDAGSESADRQLETILASLAFPAA